jgi:hypothetical protein
MMSYGRAVYPAQALSTTFPSWPTRQSSRQSSQSSPEQKALSVTSWHVTWPVLRIFVHVCSYLDFGVAEELSDFSCIACGIYKMRCCNPTATTYQMRSLEPCIADGFAPVKKATHVSLQWLIHENPNPCRAHPAPGLQVCRTFNSLLWLWMVMACYGIPCAWNRVQVLGSANPSDIIP